MRNYLRAVHNEILLDRMVAHDLVSPGGDGLGVSAGEAQNRENRERRARISRRLDAPCLRRFTRS